jgi:nicotinate-nucleotide adenylyltransferase
LLGGSFNPAHEGHLHISQVALRVLGLDRVIWLVSPQNPLKSDSDMARMSDRVTSARQIARDPRIEVSTIENAMGTQYTVDTLSVLTRRFPATHFVWLMGADNLEQLPKWERWTCIMEAVPVAIIDRPGSGLKAQLGKVATRYAWARIDADAAATLPLTTPPAWTYIHARLHPLSASAIRAGLPSGVPWTEQIF